MSALPPYALTLGIAEEGDGVLLMPFADPVLGRPGFLHGSAISGLLDVAAVVALRRALAGAPARIKPINLTTDFMRGGRDRDTWALGVVVRLGQRLANVDASAWQGAPDKPIATARMRWMGSRDP